MLGKREWRGGVSASLSSERLVKEALPTTVVTLNGDKHSVLVDTGCSRCVAHVSCCKNWKKEAVSILNISGKEQQCEGTGVVRIQLDNGAVAEVEVIVVSVKPLGFTFILGMNGITALGGVFINGREVRFGTANTNVCAAAVGKVIEERDFTASYDTASRSWTAAWKWSNGKEPGLLKNQMEAYGVPRGVRAQYEEEIDKWIEDKWMVPFDERKHGPAKGLIPLMVVIQHNKGKVRPVLDFRELNSYIDTFTADADVCADKMREWRRKGTNVSIVDLKKAYLQIHIHESLWPYQTVMYKGRRYCLTRLGFGLNVAPLVMKAVLNSVLSQDPDVRRGTSAYIDDIIVNEDIVAANRVLEHLEQYGLAAKTPERVAKGARVLGLKVWGEHHSLAWGRDGRISELPEQLTRRSVFSYCGKLVGHFPVCGWLRVASAYVKRRVNLSTRGWDDAVVGEEPRMLLTEILTRVKKDDPARGRWDVKGDTARVWVDASSLALGAAVEVDGCIIEDASWLRPEGTDHINMAELDSVIKGLNLALAWQMKTVELMSDSTTVCRWVEDALTGRARLKTKAASEMLIRRRLGIIVSLVKECGLSLSITRISSAENKADSLTRVPQRWLKASSTVDLSPSVCAIAADPAIDQLVADVHHSRGHPGVRRTLYFARRVNPAVTRGQVRSITTTCQECLSIDPAPAKWHTGDLSVIGIWQRVGMDITHCKGQSYLSLIDCGPSRFTIWRLLQLQTSDCVIKHLEAVFFERGAPQELLTDNDTAFRSKLFSQFALRWNVRVHYRGAYAPSGNGIVERCHRTVKVIAARKGCSIAEAVYLYNITPSDDCTQSSAPGNVIYNYAMRVRGEAEIERNVRVQHNPYQMGDNVWVKPPRGRCDDRYKEGTVTSIVSDQVAEVDQIPRHVKDLRKRSSSRQRQEQDIIASESSDDELIMAFPVQDDADVGQRRVIEEGEAEQPLRRSTRIARRRQCLVCD